MENLKSFETVKAINFMANYWFLIPITAISMTGNGKLSKAGEIAK